MRKGVILGVTLLNLSFATLSIANIHNNRDLEAYCNDRSVCYELVQSIEKYDNTIDAFEITDKLSVYANDEYGVDVVDGLTEALGCSLEDAISIVEYSDSLQENK